MRQYLGRLILSAFVSACLFAGTYWWYQSSSKSLSRVTQKKPLAKLSVAVNEVQRKPVERLIWEPLQQEELLYSGEQVKTLPASEARIEFLSSGALIDMEPDSLVVIEELDNKISLDFLKGNVFVKTVANQAGEPPSADEPIEATAVGEGRRRGGGGLVVKSGNSKIEVKDAEVAMNKAATGEVGVSVVKGQAEAQVNGKSVTLTNEKSGVIASTGVTEQAVNFVATVPANNSSVFFDPEKEATVKFEWKPLPAGYVVGLWMGKSRSDLSEISGATSDGTKGALSSKVKAGKYFWKLVAKNQGATGVPIETVVQRVELRAKLAPRLESPTNETQEVVGGDHREIRFKWAGGKIFSSYAIEISKNPSLQPAELVQNNLTQEEFNTSSIQAAGVYYWRVTGYLEGTQEAVSSKLFKFELVVEQTVPAPLLVGPNDKANIQSEDAKGGVYLNWRTIPGVAKYRIDIRKTQDGNPSPSKILDVKAPPHKFIPESPGTYQWSVMAIGKQGKEGPLSVARNFTVEELAELTWASDSSNYLYTTKEPTLGVAWRPVGEAEAVYSLRVTAKGQEPAIDGWTDLKATKWVGRLLADGEYEVELVAKDPKGKLIARAKNRDVNVAPRPVLPGPQYSATVPDVLRAQKNGTAALEWQPVQGAQQYVVEVKNAEGKLVKEIKVSKTTTAVPGLRPGQYKVSTRAIDEFGRVGQASPEKMLEVPTLSDVRAPKLKGLKIK